MRIVACLNADLFSCLAINRLLHFVEQRVRVPGMIGGGK